MQTIGIVLGLIVLIFVIDELYSRWRLRRKLRLLASGKWKLGE